MVHVSKCRTTTSKHLYFDSTTSLDHVFPCIYWKTLAPPSSTSLRLVTSATRGVGIERRTAVPAIARSSALDEQLSSGVIDVLEAIGPEVNPSEPEEYVGEKHAMGENPALINIAMMMMMMMTFLSEQFLFSIQGLFFKCNTPLTHNYSLPTTPVPVAIAREDPGHVRTSVDFKCIQVRPPLLYAKKIYQYFREPLYMGALSPDHMRFHHLVKPVDHSTAEPSTHIPMAHHKQAAPVQPTYYDWIMPSAYVVFYQQNFTPFSRPITN